MFFNFKLIKLFIYKLLEFQNQLIQNTKIYHQDIIMLHVILLLCHLSIFINRFNVNINLIQLWIALESLEKWEKHLNYNQIKMKTKLKINRKQNWIDLIVFLCKNSFLNKQIYFKLISTVTPTFFHHLLKNIYYFLFVIC